jgi:hypothetical protein
MDPVNERITSSFDVFQDLVRTSQAFLTEGQWTAAAAYAQIAAHYASVHHSGIFASRTLERILGQIGQVVRPVPQKGQTVRDYKAAPRNILHVLTEAFSTGGHTRFVWRWIAQDVDRCHSVALTRQGDRNVPEALRGAVQSAGGRIHFLDRRPGGVLSRAHRLRVLASAFDHIVLHIHPHDVVPILAFSRKGSGPPVTLLNHADHLFWLGVSVADQVANIRESGASLCQDRRGLARDKCILLPIPLHANTSRITRGEARKLLGLSENTLVLLSIAAAHKYMATDCPHFVDALLPVLQGHPNAVLLVVGPEESKEWAEGVRRAQGRIKVLGKREDINVFYEAADVYLDSFPVGSLTSLLDAGVRGIPLVSYCPHPQARVLCCDDPALSEAQIRVGDVNEFRERIGELLENCEHRLRQGELTKNSVLAVHDGKGWGAFVQDLYLRASHPHAVSEEQEGSDVPQASELDTLLARVYDSAGLARGVPAIVRSHVGLLPFGVRTGLWRSMFGRDWRSFPGCILPDWIKTELKLLRR